MSNTIPAILRTVRRSALIVLPITVFGINAACPEPVVDLIQDLNSSTVLQAVEKNELEILESGATFKIYDAGVKRYGEFNALVQSSNEPISLGVEMRPYMDT